MTVDVYRALTVLVTQVCLGGYVMLLVDFRQPQLKWRLRWVVLAALVVAANLVSILALDYWSVYTSMGVLTMTLPYVLITLWCSRYRGLRAVFNITTTLFIGCVGSANGILVQSMMGTWGLCPILVRLASFLVIFAVLGKFSYAYRQMLRLLDGGWGVLCLIPVTTFLTMLYATNILMSRYPLQVIVVLYGLLIVAGSAYCLMYLFFDRVQQANDARSNRKLLELQVSALRGRMEAIQALEHAVRVERHDLRHRLQTVAELTARGDKEAALDFLDAARKRLDVQPGARWCAPPVLDAVFSAYFDQARSQGIRLETRLSLPETLPVDEGELAIVFANALENAICACLELPEEQRELRCEVMAAPSLILEITNPCKGQVCFDRRGLPVTDREGHGLGISSIVAFAEKYQASYQFDVADGRFRFLLVL